MIIGPAVDEKIFVVMDMYEEGIISAENVIKLVQEIGYSRQVVLKTAKAVAKLRCLGIRVFFEQEKQKLQCRFEAGAREGHKRMRELLQKINGRRGDMYNDA